MKSLLDAVQRDIEGDYVRAADHYEQVIQAGGASLEAYLNLAVLYWQCTDYGFNASHKLDIEFIHKSGERYQLLLQEAGQRFSNRPEIKFWVLYCDYITLGNPPFVEECKLLVDASNQTLVPYFYLYSASQGSEYEAKAHILLEECLKHPTVKNKYIASVIKSVASTLIAKM